MHYLDSCNNILIFIIKINGSKYAEKSVIGGEKKE